MNSRGKPLTPFEVFKADFESTIEVRRPERHKHLVDSIDGAWADILWEYEKTARRRLQDRRRVRALPDLRHRHLRVARRRARPQMARQRPRADCGRSRSERPSPSLTPRTRTPNEIVTSSSMPSTPGLAPTPRRARNCSRRAVSGTGRSRCSPRPPTCSALAFPSTALSFSARRRCCCLGSSSRGRLVTPSSPRVHQRLRSLRNVTAAFLDRDRYMSNYVHRPRSSILGGTFDELEGFRGDWVADEAFKWAPGRAPRDHGCLHALEDDPLIRDE